MKAAIAVIVFWLGVAALADVIAPQPNAVDKASPPFSAPDTRHVLGTDGARRDALARVVHGTRLTVIVGGLATLVLLWAGIAVGLAAGYASPAIDAVLMRATDAILALPITLIVLTIAGVVPRAGATVVAVAIGLTAWPPLARILRVETQRLRSSEFVLAARMMGGGPFYILRTHILPHLTHYVGVAAAFGFATATMVEASLAFLGFGPPDDVASWGGLMRQGEQHPASWWLVVVPGLALVSLTLAVSSLSDGSWRGRPAPASVVNHG